VTKQANTYLVFKGPKAIYTKGLD